MNDSTEPIAKVADYGSLIDALERRRVELNLSLIEVDERAGLSAGHWSHIAKWRSPQGRNLGPTSFARVLSALGLELHIHVKKEIPPGTRNAAMARSRQAAAGGS